MSTKAQSLRSRAAKNRCNFCKKNIQQVKFGPCYKEFRAWHKSAFKSSFREKILKFDFPWAAGPFFYFKIEFPAVFSIFGHDHLGGGSSDPRWPEDQTKNLVCDRSKSWSGSYLKVFERCCYCSTGRCTQFSTNTAGCSRARASVESFESFESCMRRAELLN